MIKGSILIHALISHNLQTTDVNKIDYKCKFSWETFGPGIKGDASLTCTTNLNTAVTPKTAQGGLKEHEKTYINDFFLFLSQLHGYSDVSQVIIL